MQWTRVDRSTKIVQKSPTIVIICNVLNFIFPQRRMQKNKTPVCPLQKKSLVIPYGTVKLGIEGAVQYVPGGQGNSSIFQDNMEITKNNALMPQNSPIQACALKFYRRTAHKMIKKINSPSIKNWAINRNPFAKEAFLFIQLLMADVHEWVRSNMHSPFTVSGFEYKMRYPMKINTNVRSTYFFIEKRRCLDLLFLIYQGFSLYPY